MGNLEKDCNDCGGVGVVGDPANKVGAPLKTITCPTCNGVGKVASESLDLPDPTYTSLESESLYDFEALESHAYKKIGEDRVTRNVATPPGWELSIVLPPAPRARYDASPRMGIASLYTMDQLNSYADESVFADRSLIQNTNQEAALRAGIQGVSFDKWYTDITVEGSMEYNMRRAWDDGRSTLMSSLLGSRLEDIRASFEAHCRSIGKKDRDLERASAHSARITGGDYTWGDINQRWETWKAAAATYIIHQEKSANV